MFVVCDIVEVILFFYFLVSFLIFSKLFVFFEALSGNVSIYFLRLFRGLGGLMLFVFSVVFDILLVLKL